MSNGLFFGDKDPVEIRVGNRKATSVFLGDKKVWSNVPDGAILHLSAKGLTTEGIAQSGGVTDLSGNGNNGTAYGGVEVVNDSEMGECFSFDGVNDYLQLENNALLNLTAVSLNFKIKFTVNNTARDYILLYGDFNQLLIQTYNGSQNTLQFYARGAKNDRLQLIAFDYALNTPYHISFNIDFITGHARVYINGVFLGESYNQTTNSYIHETPQFRIGREHSGMSGGNWFFKGLISEVKIFPYALNAHEVKKLYRASRR